MMEYRTILPARLRGILLISALLSNAGNLAAQTGSDDITKFYDTQRGYTNPASPEAWSMVKYGDAELNLYTGTLGLSIPVYTFKNKNFTIPISLNYASTGYKPNLQTGILGAGWYLNAGGVITREVNGIPDESVEAYTYKDKYAGGEKDWGLSDVGKRTHEMSGYYQVYTNPSVSNRSLEELLYSGSSAQEYVIAYQNAPYDEYFETEPDLFHYNFMGYTGSFILQPGKIVVFDCNTPPGELKIETFHHGEYGGLKGFVITTGDGYEYSFSEADSSSTYGFDTSDNGTSVVSTWTLDSITSEDGARVSFQYDSGSYSYSCIPNIYYEYEYERKRLHMTEDEYDPAPDMIQMQGIDVNQVSTYVVSKITIGGEAEIEFTYVDKKSEWWDYSIVSRQIYNDNKEQNRRLDRITVKNLFTGKTLKTCSLGYNLNNSRAITKRLTLLTSVTLSGEGTYTMQYYRENEDCPPINTFAIDWWGYFNGKEENNNIPVSHISQSHFFPNHVDGVISTAYHQRDADFDSALYGMLRQIKYPTGGYSLFTYEANDYGKKVVRDNDHAYIPMLHDGAGITGGVRIRVISDSPSKDYGHGLFREFYYSAALNVSSGILLWEPQVYTKYKLETAGYDIKRSFINTRQSFPYSRSSHIEYSKVKETRRSMDDPHNVCNIEHLFNTSEQYLDQFAPEDYASDWGWDLDFYITEELPSFLNRLRYLYCQVFSRSSLRGRPLSKTYSDNATPVYTETYTYTGDRYPFSDYIRIPSSFLGKAVLQRINTSSYFPRLTHKIYSPGPSPRLSTYAENHYNDLGQLSRVEQGDSKGNRRVTHTVRSGDVLSGSETAGWTDWYGPPAYPLEQTVYLEKPDSTRIVLSSVRCAYTSVTGVDEKAVTCLESLSRAKITPGIHPDSIVYRTELHNDRFDLCGNVLQSTDKSGLKSCYVWGYNGAWVVARIDNASLEQITPLLSADITLEPLLRGLSTAEKNALQAIPEAQTTTYDYQPLAGIREIRDPSGRTATFEYDEHDRLFRTRDDKNKPLSEYRYHIISAQ